MAQHKIAKISDIPEGQGKTFTVEGQEVAVFNKGGQFFCNRQHLLTQSGTFRRRKSGRRNGHLPFARVAI